MTKQVVALSVDKVQAFLTEVIHAHVQEKQKEEATLKSIMRSSRTISCDFHNDIKQKFSEDALLACSGVYIFTTELPEAEIKSKCDALFRDYYLASQGQQMLRYVSFPLENMDKLGAIRRAKGLLKSCDCTRDIIAGNRDMLFSFQKIGDTEKVRAKTEQVNEDKISYSSFAEHIDKLFRPVTTRESNENRFRIAVIKADLDGMGAMFQNIKTYEEYDAISKVLNKYVCLQALNDEAEGVSKRQGWLMPFYIAGDDIFFAVAVCDLTYGIEVCRKILERINTEIEQDDKIAHKVSKPLSMSIGVEITFNRQPVRYYMEQVEEQLKCAKKATISKLPQKLRSAVKTKIAIDGMAFFDLADKDIKAYKDSLKTNYKKEKGNGVLQCIPIWNYFMHDVRRLQQFREKGHDSFAGSSNSLYTLLERITDETIRKCDTDEGREEKYWNSVFYHLLPRYMEGADLELSQLELVFNASIMKRLYQADEKTGLILSLNDTTRKRLETYLRLLILLSDVRFQINSKEEGQKTINVAELKCARKMLLVLPSEHLYSILSSNHGEMLKFFVIKDKRGKKNSAGKPFEQFYFKRLNIDKSMFFKMRDTKKIDYVKAAKMIEIRNPSTEEAKTKVEEKNSELSNAGKIPHHLFFDKESFLHAQGTWTPDFIDSLMLFYAYHRFSLQAKRLIPKEEGGTNRG